MNTKKILSLVLSVILVFAALVVLSSCGKQHEHTFEEAWTTDATNHWHKATCEHTEEKGDLAAHADADKNGACDVCNYAMGGTGSGTSNTPTKPAVPQVKTYTVTVKNSKGDAVEGVFVKLVAKANDNDNYGDYIPAKATDAEGKVAFEVNPSFWSAQIESAPEGYASEVEHDEELNLDFVKKYAFGDATELVITLVDAPAAAE